MSKVFCKDCKWLAILGRSVTEVTDPSSLNSICYTNNGDLVSCGAGDTIETWFSTSEKKSDPPHRRNANNDCPHYEPKEEHLGLQERKEKEPEA